MNQFKSKNYLFISILAIFAVASLMQAGDLKVTATVNSNQITVDEQFTVTLTVEGGSNLNSVEPVLPNIDEFAAYTGSNQSSNFQFINGRMSSSKTITYYYIARKVGSFTIPAIVVKHQRDSYQTQPITLQITKAPQSAPGQQQRLASGQQPASSTAIEDNMYLKAEVDKKNVYVGEPVTISYVIYTALQVTNYSLSNKPNYGDFWSEEIPMKGSPATTERIINGRRFLVATLKKIVLFPTSSGVKTIPPQEVEVAVRMRERRAKRDIFDSFFDDPFFGRTVNQVLKSNELELEIKPLPVTGQPRGFSGSVGRFSMTTSVDKRQVKTNEAITLKAVIAGEGNIRTLSLPQPNFPKSFEVYDPKIGENIERDNGKIKGRKTFEYVIIPRDEGNFRIEPLSFTYFDIGENQYKTISRGPIDIEVEKNDRQVVASPRGLSKSEVKLLGKDIRYISLENEAFSQIDKKFYTSFLFWIILLSPALIVVAGVAYSRHQEKLGTNVAYARSRKAQKVASRQLKAAHMAMKNRDVSGFYTELARALTAFVGNKLNVQESALVRDELIKSLLARGIESATVETFDAILQECDFHRFAMPDAPETAMEKAYQKVNELIVSLEKNL
ncbi:MAG: protein BatD [Deferribacteres bacterium]|nr:protein BatD [candidate division KSB1 bacterium]MCB9500756.1 protein BatD [Deferribacteres bacterium]